MHIIERSAKTLSECGFHDLEIDSRIYASVFSPPYTITFLADLRKQRLHFFISHIVGKTRERQLQFQRKTEERKET